MVWIRRLAAVAVGAVLGPGLAGQAAADNEIDSATLYFENDQFAVANTSDRWYTHGTKLIWTYRDPNPVGPFGLLADVPRLLLWRGSDAGSGPLTIAAQIGQNIYTPQELNKTFFEPRDRPYAGWLYVGAIAQRPIGRWVETTDIKVGVTGPASLARQTQNLGHHVLTGDQAQGWDFQVRPRLGVEAGYLGRYMLPPVLGWIGVTPHVGATVGSLRNLVHVGFSVVVGSRLADAAVPGAGEGIGDTLTPISDPVGARGSLLSGLYGFFGFDSSWVGNNVFIDGDTYGGTPTVTLRHRVQQAMAGVAMVLPDTWLGRGARFGYAYFNRSQEFDSLGFTPSPRQHFGTLWLTVKF